MSRRSRFLAGYKKNFKFGFTAAVGIGIAAVLWGFVEPIVGFFAPWLQKLPFLGSAPRILLVLLSALIWFLVVFAAIGWIARIPIQISEWIGQERERTLRWAYWLRKPARFFLFRPFKSLYRGSLKTIIRSSTMIGALDRLFVVLVPYLGGEYYAWVTRVQRVWSHDSCIEDDGSSCSSATCTSGVLVGYRLWVFLADWPVMVMGKPLGYPMEKCIVPAISASEAASQIATLGISAKADAHERKLTKHDLRSVIDAIADSEPILVVAGIIDPDVAEQLWIERGDIAPNWREEN